MKLDADNRAFKAALLVVEETNRNLFLTGKAGTGKTTFLHYIRQHVKKQMAIVAPTGVAAINAGGMTIHSLFQIQPSVYPPNDVRLRHKPMPGDPDKMTIYRHFQLSQTKKELLKKIRLLVIDEISMVRCDLLDVIDQLLRTFGGGNAAYPFGGKQVLFIGDAFQLPPVAPGDEWDILSPHYRSPYFFSAHSFTESSPQLIELQKIYRQTDRSFVSLLNRVRTGDSTEQDLHILNERIRPGSDFDYARQGYIYLGTRNQAVNRRNAEQLAKLPAVAHTFTAQITGDFTEREMPTLPKLELKEGAQVMFVKNEAGENRRYYNGKVGTVAGIEEEVIKVDCDGTLIAVEREVWRKIRYEWDDAIGKIIEVETGSFTQYPLKLAWAITVHKSQGLTFEKVYADLRGAFADGQVYVALSRCTALQGLYLASRLSRLDIKTSDEVLRFAQRFMQDEEVNEMLRQLEFMVEAEPLEQALERNDLETALRELLRLKKQENTETEQLGKLEQRLFKKIRKLQQQQQWQRIKIRRLTDALKKNKKR